MCAIMLLTFLMSQNSNDVDDFAVIEPEGVYMVRDLPSFARSHAVTGKTCTLQVFVIVAHVNPLVEFYDIPNLEGKIGKCY